MRIQRLISGVILTRVVRIRILIFVGYLHRMIIILEKLRGTMFSGVLQQYGKSKDFRVFCLGRSLRLLHVID